MSFGADSQSHRNLKKEYKISLCERTRSFFLCTHILVQFEEREKKATIKMGVLYKNIFVSNAKSLEYILKINNIG